VTRRSHPGAPRHRAGTSGRERRGSAGGRGSHRHEDEEARSMAGLFFFRRL